MKKEEKVVFGISYEGQGDGVPLIMMGIPAAAWDYMRDGKTHTFDLTKAGLPVKVILFGAKTHDDVVKVFGQINAAAGAPYIDARNQDFSIKDKETK